MDGKLSSPGGAGSTYPRLALTRRAGRYRPGGPPVIPRFVGVVEVWKDLSSEDETLSSPGDAGSTNSGLGFPHRVGRYGPGASHFSSPVCWSCRCMEGFVIRGWDFILPGWRRLCELRTPGWGVHTVRGEIDPGDGRFVPGLQELMYGRIFRAWGYRPGGAPFSSPVCWSCRCME